MNKFDLTPLSPDTESESQRDELHGEPAWFVITMWFVFAFLVTVTMFCSLIGRLQLTKARVTPPLKPVETNSPKNYEHRIEIDN